MAADRSTWCVLPWVHVCIRPDGMLKPCCRYNKHGEFQKETIDELDRNGVSVMDSADFVELRRKMLAGEKADGCIKCDQQDEYSDLKDRISLRTYSNQKFPTLSKDDCDLGFNNVRYIEMSIDNICNLQCKMCSSYFSSKLALRDKFLGLPVHKKLEPNFKKFDKIDLSKLERLKILGGEPLMTPNLDPFLDYISMKSDMSAIVLELVTNGTTIPSDVIINKLNRFKRVKILVSLDAYDRSNDYQRYGSSYIDTFSNAQKLEKLLTNSELSFHAATTMLTATHLSRTLDYVTGKNGYHMSVDFVRDPEYLSLHLAPKPFLEWLLEMNAGNRVAYRMLETVVQNSKYSESDWKSFLEFIKKTDSYHGINIIDYNPELWEYIRGQYHA